MIAIVNVSKRLRTRGLQDYEVRINRMPVCRFQHRREEGLEVCLRRAAAAVEENRGEIRLRGLIIDKWFMERRGK